MSDEPKPDIKPESPSAPQPATAPGSAAAADGKATTPAPPAKPAAKAPPAAPTGPADPPPPEGTVTPAFIAELQSTHSGAVEQVSYWVGDWTVVVSASQLTDVARYLRDAPATAFDYCSDVTASDWPPRAKRFDVVYCLYSTQHRHRVRLKVRAGDGDPVPSMCEIWPAANWLEREVYDLFGVNFIGHPDRRRILMPDEWQGHPQRKDYPLEGPGEFLMENPQDWLRLKNLRAEADIE